MADCAKGHNCFSENGCTKERYLHLPEDDPKLIKMGFKTKCVSNTKCTHDYCGKYKWILDRAQHYAEKTGTTQTQVLEDWENDRSYWYMNYYQDSNQTELTSEKIIRYDDWIAELQLRFGTDSKQWAFKCPSCGNVQTANDFLQHNVGHAKDNVYYSCIGRYVEGIGCNWTLGGLFQINKVSVLKGAKVFPVFEMADGDVR